MKGLCGIVCVLVICRPFAQGQDLKVTLTSDKREVKVGEEVKLVCMTTNNNVLTEPVNWYKVSLDDPSQLKIISKFVTLEPSFQGQMTLDAKAVAGASEPSTYFTLTIKAVKKENDGQYMCAIVDKDGRRLKEAQIDLVVLNPVQQLTLQVGPFRSQNNSPRNIYTLREFGNNLAVTCKADGSNPKARLTLKIGNKDVTTAMKVASRETSDVEISEAPFDRVRSWSTTIYDADLFKKEHVNKKIECSAYSKGVGSDPKVASMVIRLNTRPVFKCKDVNVTIGSSATLECTITHSMGPIDNIQWVDQHKQLVIRPGKQTTGYQTKMESVGKNTVRAQLTIDHVIRKQNIYQVEIDHHGWKLDHKVRVDAVHDSNPNSVEALRTSPVFSIAVAITSSFAAAFRV